MNLLDNIYGVLFKPKDIFYNFFTRSNFTGSFVIIAFLSIINTFSLDIAGFLVPMGMSFTFLLNLVIWLSLSFILTFTSDILKGEGKISDTMTAVAYSSLPLIFIHPLNALSFTFGLEFMNSIFTPLIYLWSLALLVISLKYAHKYDLGRSVLSILGILSFLIFSITAIVIFVIFGAVLISSSF